MPSEVHFNLLDYSCFAIVFIVSITIGLYFALKSRKQEHSLDEYFFGRRELGVLPIAFSLLATSISGSTIIGHSMEVYAYGLHCVMFIVIIPILVFIIPSIFLSVFYDLQLMSSFSYLELRFDRSVKHLASGLYVMTGLLLIPFTIYVPALALQEVSEIDLYVICTVSGGICILYTSIGGFRAVVWADVFQFLLIISSILIIFSIGLVNIGGFQNVWDALERGKRLKIFKTDLNLETRGSLWAYLSSIFILTIYNLSLSQSSIQRYISLPTFKKTKQAFWIQIAFVEIVLLLQFTIGAIIYATYEECDPLKAGIVKKIDQIFPYFVQEKASLFPGFNGIFIAGIFSAGLSTTSTLLNTVSGTIYMDFLRSRIKNTPKRSTSRIMKIIVAIVGVIGIGLIFVIERLGTVFVINIICLSVTTVGVFGLFCSGMFFKNINSKGAKSGVLVAMLVIVTLIVGSLKKNPDPTLPFRTDGCHLLNSTNFQDIRNTTDSRLNENHEELPWIFRINFQFFCLIGLIVSISVGTIVSYVTGGNTVDDERLLVKFLRRKVATETLL